MDIRSIPMQDNDSGATTVGGYLANLLATLWSEGECFSGKRPFGNSGWEYDVYHALVSAGAVDGKIDDDGDLDHFDEQTANSLVFQAIDLMAGV